MDILERIVQAKRAQIARDKAEAPLRRVIELATTALPPRDFPAALRRGGRASIIAEIKRASPSKGDIQPGADVARVAETYERAGAAALSVLTEAGFFLGAPEHLGEAKRAVSVPVLRKDFILEEYQLWESRLFGADAVLLIVAALAPTQLRELMQAAKGLGLGSLVEVHTREELDVALTAGASLIGVNNRNLQTFETSLEISLALIPTIPEGPIVVRESGIFTREDVLRVVAAGAHAVLVGEALVRAADVAAKVRELALLDQQKLSADR